MAPHVHPRTGDWCCAEAEDEPQFRMKFILVSQYFLRLMRCARDSYGFNAMELEVFLTVCSATAEKILRNPQHRALYGDKTQIPMSELGFVSARSVCAATGLNRETVRRTVNALVDGGWLIRTEKGYAMAPEALLEDRNTRFSLTAFNYIRQLSEKWGKLDGQPAAPAPAAAPAAASAAPAEVTYLRRAALPNGRRLHQSIAG